MKRYAPGMKLQLAAMHARIAGGMLRRGWKIGINVPEVQRRLGLSHALVGWLDGDRVLSSGSALRCEAGSLLHVEPEICLRLAGPVDARSDPEAARAAIDAVAPAIEIVDYAKPMSTLTDIVSHSMFHSACVLGEWIPVPGEEQIDISSDVRLRVGSQQSTPARVDLVPRDLSEILLLVARMLDEFDEGLLAGDILLSGAYTESAMALRARQTAVAELGMVGVVSCSLR